MNEIVKFCMVHGELTIEQTCKDGKRIRCKICKHAKNKRSYYKHREKKIAASIAWKQKNKERLSEWAKQDRKLYPEKYKKYEENHKKRYGLEHIRRREVLRIHGITKEEHDSILASQNYVCIICKMAETRKGKTGDITPLCIDHCHICEEKGVHIVRGLLCHACNTALGKFKDSIEFLEKAIEYLKAHKHVE